MNNYEDEEGTPDTSVLGFLRRNKQLMWMAVAFLVAYTFMSWSSSQMDEFGADEKVERAVEHQRANPWSVDQ